MKKMILWFVVLMLLSASAYAQSPELGKPGTPQQVPGWMMQDSPMMRRGMSMEDMMGRRMMMEDLLNLMGEIVAVQEKLTKGVKQKERETLLREISMMKEKIEKIGAEMKKRMKAMHSSTQTVPSEEGLPKSQSKDVPAQQPAHQH